MPVPERPTEIEVLSKREFEVKAKGLPYLLRPDFSADILYIESIDPEYFGNDQRQRCIVKRNDGQLFISYYD